MEILRFKNRRQGRVLMGNRKRRMLKKIKLKIEGGQTRNRIQQCFYN